VNVACLGKNEVLNIDQTKHLDEFLVFLIREDLGHSVSKHFCCRNPVDMDVSILNFLAKPMSMDIDMSKLRAEHGVFLSE
jgi:hypothetical protein